MPKAEIFYNPDAGRFRSRFLIKLATNVLRNHGWQVDIKQTQSGEHARELARQAAEQGIEAVIVAGGDGSLEHAIAGLLGSKTALGVLPSGTANVWAQEIGMPVLTWTNWTALQRSAHQLSRAKIQTVDVGFCNGRPFLLWAGVGLDAFIVHSVEPRWRWKKYFGTAQYAISALARASSWRGVDLIIQTDDREIRGHYILGVMSNIRLYAGGYAKLSPAALLDDGIMELWLFHGNAFRDAIRHVWDIWAGRHFHSDLVEKIAFRQIRIQSEALIYIQVDGEPVDPCRVVSLEVKHQSLRVLIPPHAPDSLFAKPPVEVMS